MLQALSRVVIECGISASQSDECQPWVTYQTQHFIPICISALAPPVTAEVSSKRSGLL